MGARPAQSQSGAKQNPQKVKNDLSNWKIRQSRAGQTFTRTAAAAVFPTYDDVPHLVKHSVKLASSSVMQPKYNISWTSFGATLFIQFASPFVLLFCKTIVSCTKHGVDKPLALSLFLLQLPPSLNMAILFLSISQTTPLTRWKREPATTILARGL